MKAITHTAADQSSVYTSLDTICMNKIDRRRAYVSLSNGKLIAELLLRAVRSLK